MKTNVTAVLFSLLIMGSGVGGAILRAADAAAGGAGGAPPGPAPSAAEAAGKPGGPGESTQGAPAALPLPKIPEIPAPVQEVIRLAQNQLSDQVLISYIANIQEPFSLNADQVIFLRDTGLSMPVIEALLKRSTPTAAKVPPSPSQVLANINAAPVPAAQPPQPQPAIPNAPVAPAAPVAGAAPGVVYGQQETVAPPAQSAQPVVVQAPAQPVTQTYFYESLSPYGSWVMVEPYGWVWQPTVAVVDTGWRPYCHGGHWLWSDAGWYWHSDYSWGWAPFHYGRWHRHGLRGWVWVPGTTWAPCWVTWRYSESHCGWAPLPPEAHWSVGVGFTHHGTSVSVGFGWGLSSWDYAFVPFGMFYDRHPYRHCIPRDRYATVVKDSTVINPTIVGNNNTVIINNGLDHKLVQKHTRDEVRKVSLRDSTAPVAPTERALGSVAGSGARPSAVAVYRPTLTQQSAAPPQHVIQRQEARKAPLTSGGGAGIVPGRSEPGVSGAGSRPAIQPGQGTSPQVRPAAPSPSGIRSTPGVTSGGAAPSAGAPASRPASPSTPYRPPSTAAPGSTTRPVPSAPATQSPRRDEPEKGRPSTGSPAQPSGRTGPQTQYQYPGSRPSVPSQQGGVVEYRAAPSVASPAPARPQALTAQPRVAPAPAQPSYRPQEFHPAPPAIRTQPSVAPQVSAPPVQRSAPARPESGGGGGRPSQQHEGGSGRNRER